MTDRGFQKPRYLECDYETLTEKYGKFTAQPFERGYGVTIGNSLRRVLLSSISGAAITNVRIQGVLHEFSSIPGAVEDVGVPLKLIGNQPKIMTLKMKGPGEAKAADIVHDPDIEILDKDVHIASMDKDGVLDIEMIVINYRGYVSADQNYDADLSVDYLPLDSSHSPIKKVNYKVELARLGKKIDYEKLILEVWTTGAVNPQDAIGQGSKILRDHLAIFLNIVDEPLLREQLDNEEEIPYMSQKDILSRSIDHLELSVRSNNCLRAGGIEKIYYLVQKTEDELLKTKNFGRKSLAEIKDTLQGLKLGLNIKLHPQLLEEIEGNNAEEEKEEGAEE